MVTLQLLLVCMIRQQHASHYKMNFMLEVVDLGNNGASLNDMTHMHHEKDEHCYTLSRVPPNLLAISSPSPTRILVAI